MFSDNMRLICPAAVITVFSSTFGNNVPTKPCDLCERGRALMDVDTVFARQDRREIHSLSALLHAQHTQK